MPTFMKRRKGSLVLNLMWMNFWYKQKGCWAAFIHLRGACASSKGNIYIHFGKYAFNICFSCREFERRLTQISRLRLEAGWESVGCGWRRAAGWFQWFVKDGVPAGRQAGTGLGKHADNRCSKTKARGKKNQGSKHVQTDRGTKELSGVNEWVVRVTRVIGSRSGGKAQVKRIRRGRKTGDGSRKKSLGTSGRQAGSNAEGAWESVVEERDWEAVCFLNFCGELGLPFTRLWAGNPISGLSKKYWTVPVNIPELGWRSKLFAGCRH